MSVGWPIGKKSWTSWKSTNGVHEVRGGRTGYEELLETSAELMNAGELKEDRVEWFKELVEVGEKNFGENNGHVYARRYRPDYYEQRVAPEGGDAFLSRNRRFRDFYGERYLDLMSFVTDDAGRVRVFTPDHHFISADCRHLSLGGAKFFAERIEWGRFLPMQ